MFRHLILAGFVIVLTVLQSQKIYAAPDNQNLDAEKGMMMAKASSPNKNVTVGFQTSFVDVGKDSSQNSKCVELGGRCNGTCDCCQRIIDAYECTLNKVDGRKYCTSTQPPPHRCPYSPLGHPCRPIQGPCTKDCHCCQRDENRKPYRVNCFMEHNSKRGHCAPQPYFVIECFPPIPPPPPSKP